MSRMLCVACALVLIFLCSCVSGDDVAIYSQLNVSDVSSVAAEAPSKPESAVSKPSATSKVTSSKAASKVEPAVSDVYTVSDFVGQNADWRLLMANRNNVIKNYTPKVKQFERKYCQNDVKYYFDERAFDDAMNMILAAKADGVDLVILSTYRTYQRQTELYNNKIQYYLNRGYSKANAEKHASTVVAIPGTSDHNLGLAIDFNYLDEKYENKPSLKWLRENGEDYGFVMRYPKGKENVTGVIYEPWHFRYVGAEHAEKMNELGMCLEEYVEYLSKNT